MKVKHLIEELTKCDPELEVITEGCDCYGDSFCLMIDNDVVICRSDGDRLEYNEEIAKKQNSYKNDQNTPIPLPQ